MPPRTKRRVTGRDREEKPVKVRGVMDRMRRRQRLLLVILASALLVPLGTYGVLQQLMGRRRGEAVATAYGHNVYEDEVQQIRRRLRIAADLARDRSGQDLVPSITEDDVWNRFVRLHEAAALGIAVAPAEVDAFLTLFYSDAEGQFSRADFEAYLGRWGGVDENEVREAVAEDLLVGGILTSLRLYAIQFQQRQFLPPAERLRLGPKLDRHLTATIEVADDEVWTFFLHARRSYEVAYVALPGEPFLAEVPAPAEADLAAFYEKHEDETAEDSDIGVGYTLPERCELRYMVAKVADFKKKATVTEAEMREHYDRNRERYRVTTRPTTAPASQPVDDDEPAKPATQPTTRAVAQPVTRPTTPAASLPAPPSTAPAASQPAAAPAAAASAPAAIPTTGPTTTRALDFRPFEDVRDEIRDELAEQKAREATRDAAKRAGNSRVRLEETYKEKPDSIDYHALAKRYDMAYVAPPGLLTARQVMDLQGLRDARDPSLGGRTADRIFFGETTYPDADLVDPEGNAYHVWATEHLTAKVTPYPDAKEDVERDLRAYRAYERAGARATELLEELKALPPGTAAPLDELAKRHSDLTVKTTKSFLLSSADYAPRRAAPDADEAARETVRQGLFARYIKEADTQPGQAAVVGDPVARLQYLIAVTKRTDPSIQDFLPARYSYRLLALEDKRERFLKAWAEEVKKRADITKKDTEGTGGGRPAQAPSDYEY